jgi:hypothetical protein
MAKRARSGGRLSIHSIDRCAEDDPRTTGASPALLGFALLAESYWRCKLESCLVHADLAAVLGVLFGDGFASDIVPQSY